MLAALAFLLVHPATFTSTRGAPAGARHEHRRGDGQHDASMVSSSIADAYVFPMSLQRWCPPFAGDSNVSE